MTTFFVSIFEFFKINFPSVKYIFIGLPISILYGTVSLLICGHLKLNLGWKTGYTRKLFHFTVFFTAMLVQLFFGMSGVFVFGGGVSLVILYALLKGRSYPMYEAMAREKDYPKETLFIIQPYVATLLGGLIINFLFSPDYVACAYLLTGFGDAIGEPVGTKYGRHKYRVPTLSEIISYRSFEGSLAVALTCLIVLISYFSMLNLPFQWWQLIMVALIVSLIEGISPHGWDNFTILVGGAALLEVLV